jgi:BMFP domain-containing protein YqiC
MSIAFQQKVKEQGAMIELLRKQIESLEQRLSALEAKRGPGRPPNDRNRIADAG